MLRLVVASEEARKLGTYPMMQEYVRFEVITAVTMKDAVFWDVTQCGSCKNRGFGGT
jgi:hypothetical protein